MEPKSSIEQGFGAELSRLAGSYQSAPRASFKHDDGNEWEGRPWSFLVDGELTSRVKTTAMAFGRFPGGRRLGHAPPPPRPLGRFGGIVCGRCRPLDVRLLRPRPKEWTREVSGREVRLARKFSYMGVDETAILFFPMVGERRIEMGAMAINRNRGRRWHAAGFPRAWAVA